MTITQSAEQVSAVEVVDMTEGQRALRNLTMGPTGQPQREVARVCRVEQATVSRWIGGSRKPEFHPRIALERAYGIPLDAWEREEMGAAS